MLLCLAAAAFAGLKVVRWNATGWIGPYLMRRHEAFDQARPLDVCFLFVDHYEPEWGRASPGEQIERAKAWEHMYKGAIMGHADSDGRCPQHTWFSPIALTHADAERVLATWPGLGWGEIEYHLHHGPRVVEDAIRKQIMQDINQLRQFGAVSSGRYGFVHGMYALAAGDPRYCTAPNEIDVLLETGCYADFTFPAIGTPAQPRQVNSIYYAQSNGQPKPYDLGPEAEVGKTQPGLLLIPGPMSFGFFPRILDDAELKPDYPPHPKRISRWLDARVHVRGRPNWVFISVHSHTARDANCDYLFGGAMQRLWRALEDRFKTADARLHYVTAREAYNIVKAAEAGRDGNPNDFRDFEIPPPVNTNKPTASRQQVDKSA